MKRVRNVFSGVEFDLDDKEFERIKADPSLGSRLELVEPKPAEDKAKQ